MTTSSVSNAPETSGGPLLRDEPALEREFRARFTALCDEARAHLGESAASAAPKVVEAAFRQAWDEREQISSEAELDGFLNEAVRRASARELSRRAKAHHLAPGAATTGAHHTATAPDVDQSWAHLTRLLHPEVVRAEAKAYTEQRRHHAAEHVADLSKPRSWTVPIVLGVAAAALAAAGVWWVTTLGEERAITRALNSTEARSLAAQPGQTGMLTLDDSTKVMLGAGSKLIIPKEFNTAMRAVKVQGAARFTVAPGNPKPFEIRAGNAAVIATGTVITVRAFPNDPGATIHVEEGRANVRFGEDTRQLNAGEAAFVDDDNVRPATPTEIAEATNWTKRRVTISRELRDVVQELNRWYGSDIKVPELKALDLRASVDAPLDSMRVAISQVEQSAGVEFAWQGQTMIFRLKKAPDAKGK